MLQTDRDTNKPSMTGDIDDVANLVTPSPRDRNPGKMQTSSNNVKYIKVTETEGDY